VIPVLMKHGLSVNESFAVNVGSLADCCKYIDRMHPWQLYHVVLTLALICGGTKWRWGRFSPSSSVSPAIVVRSTNYSTITFMYHPGNAQ
jgi:hypothetical protein